MSGVAPGTVPALLVDAARRAPDRGIAILDNRGRLSERRTYPEVLASIDRAALALRTLGVEAGDSVLVSLPTSWELLEAWLGCARLGAIPAAMPAPGPMASASDFVPSVVGRRATIGASHVIVGSALRDELEAADSESREALVTTDEIAGVAAGVAGKDIDGPDVDGEDIAFFQFTSGSTGHPRAVRIPHRAAVHNTLAIDDAVVASTGKKGSEVADTVVSWLPLNHDMGLVGCLLYAISQGLDLALLPPPSFLARPRGWLEAIAAHGQVLSPAPNFGYQLVAERVKPSDIAGLDLSGWRSAMIGADMVRPATAAAFRALAEPLGFDPGVLIPCYGLAEGTLAVTFDRAGRGPRTLPAPEGTDAGFDLAEVVCVGSPVLDTEIRIVRSTDGKPLAEGAVGRVLARGPGIFAGYHGDPDATADALRDGWLDTGDLGFIRQGELYLTGRDKDILILNGRNWMPHELEWLAEDEVGGGGALRSAAFSVARGPAGEEPVLVVETATHDASELESSGRAIRQRVGRTLGLPLADVVFVRRGKIPRTTSGKVQRKEVRRRYLEGSLDRIGPGVSAGDA